jgi:hypothetical protein
LAEQTSVELDGGELSVLLVAAQNGHLAAMQYLLEERGALMTVRDNIGRTVWRVLLIYHRHTVRIMHLLLSSLLKVMVMLDDAPAAFIAILPPQCARLCTRGRQFRAQLPSYLDSSGPRSSRTVPCLLCCDLSSPSTPRRPRRTCGRTGCACKRLERRGIERRRIRRTRRTVRMRLPSVGPFACARSTHDSDLLHDLSLSNL